MPFDFRHHPARLVRETLAAVCGFPYVVSTKIYRSTKDRPHFYMVYATKSTAGLDAFRETEYGAVKAHARERANAMDRKDEEETGTASFFTGMNADLKEAAVDDVIEANKNEAAEVLLDKLREAGGKLRFDALWPVLLHGFMLRITDVKKICAKLAKEGRIESTWGAGNHKPKPHTIIKLKA